MYYRIAEFDFDGIKEFLYGKDFYNLNLMFKSVFVEHIINPKNIFALALMVDGEPQSILIYDRAKKGKLYIDLLETAIEQRGKGYASVLMKDFVKSIEPEYCEVELDCFYGLTFFYKRFGFSNTGDERYIVLEKDYQYKMKLN